MSKLEQMPIVDKLKPPFDDQIVGVVAVIYDFKTGEFLLAREFVDKPQYDKKIRDLSPPAGGRDRKNGVLENLWTETLPREIREETGFQESQYVVNPIPIGWFQFSSTQGQPWIIAYRVGVRHTVRMEQSIESIDNETGFPVWVDPLSINLSKLPLRGGMKEILKACLMGKERVIKTINSATHSDDYDMVDTLIPKYIINSKGDFRDLLQERLLISQ
ncbi:MAG: hypothetical protein US11_C0006G0002 [Candidatus Roizmanbacteria bacterium GW2011_GWA2_36_23]|uniref:Nudix hydrolase domain-containing protein n=1 Tax=Candidatus Roizmanbacteria bacterium GW2011_GWA2_36_23 TaxID=1618480 RepID=A0A0G0EKI4_9BACT|nr:MAG: hypothetical protein US11_C0006G0002 [Candidatus Roizmanbacteria bacterium GW2011_GWA2_36_23]